jgi:hydrogenase maturation protein HypF
MMSLFGITEPEAVIVDLHPRYETVKMGEELARKLSVPILRTQHHKAHASSLLADSGISRMPVIVIDGVGYGDDGKPWGGEVMKASSEDVERIGHLQDFGLPGGDSSVYHPERIAHWLTYENGSDLDINDKVAERILSTTHSQAIMTSSLGRLLDALSSLLLGITWRSYDGEPAMRLERLLSLADEPQRDPFSIPVINGTVDVIGRWSILLKELGCQDDLKLMNRENDVHAANLSMGMISSILDDMVNISLQNGIGEKDEEDRPYVGISGGVAFNTWITREFIDIVKARGGRPVLHSRVPPGDGGISIGQAMLIGELD